MQSHALKLMMFAALLLGACHSSTVEESVTAAPALSSRIEEHLRLKGRELIIALSAPLVLQALDNKEHTTQTEEVLIALDQKLQKAPEGDPALAALLTSACAEELAGYQDAHPEYVEIIITDSHGMNVCQTGRTSDFYQADEQWWQETYHYGTGKEGHSGIEYDESAGAEAISIYVPLRATPEGPVIGVAKAVVDLFSLKQEI